MNVEHRAIVTIRVGINGFGRIGRNFYRAVACSSPRVRREHPVGAQR